MYKSSHVKLGKEGERYVLDLLRGLGVVCDYGTPGDVLTGTISIEVKSARPTLDAEHATERWQFCINRWQHTHFRSDFLVLLCYNCKLDLVKSYVIPGRHVNGNPKLVIPTTTTLDKWGEWVDAWGEILTHEGVEYARAST